MSMQVQGQSNINVTTASTVTAAGTQAASSIFNAKQPQAASQQTGEENEKLIQKFETELDKLLSNYQGITKEELKQIAQEAGFKKKEGATLTEEKVAKMLHYIKEALDKSSEIDENGNKVINKDKLKAHYNESYKKILESVKKGLGSILEKYLPNGKTLLNATPEEFKAAVEKFLTESIKKIKGKNLTPEQLKQQQNEFKALLASTPDEIKVKIWDAAKELLSENGIIKEAITEMIKSYVTPEHLQAFLKKVSQEDLKKLGINTDGLMQAVRNAGDNPEAIVNVMDSLVKIIEDFYKNNNETIDRCRQKILDYKKQNNLADTEKLTVEQFKEVLGEDYEFYGSLQNLETMLAGGTIGAAENNIDTKHWYTQLQEQDYKYSLDNIYSQIKEFIEVHKDELNITPEQFRDILNIATNNEYGKITGDVSPESQNSKSAAESGAEYGYTVAKYTEQSYIEARKKIDEIKQSWVKEDKPEKFVVEKNSGKTTPNENNKSNAYTDFASYKNNETSLLDELIGNFSHIKNDAIRKDIAKKVSKFRDRASVVKNNLLAKLVNKEKNFDTDEMEQLKRNGVSGIVINSMKTEETV